MATGASRILRLYLGGGLVLYGFGYVKDQVFFAICLMSFPEHCLVHTSGLDQVWDESYVHQVPPPSPRGQGYSSCSESLDWHPYHAHSVTRSLNPRISILQSCLFHPSRCPQSGFGRQGLCQARRTSTLQQHPSGENMCDAGTPPKPDRISIEKSLRKGCISSYQPSCLLSRCTSPRPANLIWCHPFFIVIQSVRHSDPNINIGAIEET
jgi:hypothetical protein